MKIKFICLLLALCLCGAVALADNADYWQLAKDVLLTAEPIEVMVSPEYSELVYDLDTLVTLVETAKARGLETEGFEYLTTETDCSCDYVLDVMACLAYGSDYHGFWTLEQQYDFYKTLKDAGIVSYQFAGMPEESDMTEEQARTYATYLMYWNFGVDVPADSNDDFLYAVQFCLNGMSEDDFCWNVDVVDLAQGEAYSVIFDRQGQLLDAMTTLPEAMDEGTAYFLRLPLAFMPLAEQVRLMGESELLPSPRSMPLPGEPTEDMVVEMAINDLMAGSGNDVREHHVTGEELRAVLDTLQVGVICQRFGDSVMWEVLFANDPGEPSEGFRVVYVYDMHTNTFFDAWLHDITDYSNG